MTVIRDGKETVKYERKEAIPQTSLRYAMGASVKERFFIIMVIAGLLLTGCGKAKNSEKDTEQTTLRIGMMSSLDVIPYELMKEKKLDEKYGFQLKLEVFTAAKDRDAAFTAGELDGVLTDYIGVCMYQNGGFDVRITGITDGDYLLLAGKNAGIKDIGGIKGRSVAISENTLIEYTLDSILGNNGLQPEAVKKEAIPRIPDRLEMLRNDKIDLVLLPEPFATLALNDGAVYLGSANEYGLYPAVSAFSKKALGEKEESVRSLYKAYNEMVDYINGTDASEYEDAVIKAAGYPEEMKGHIEIKQFRTSKLPEKGEVKAAIAWAADKGLCSKELTYDKVVYDVYK